MPERRGILPASVKPLVARPPSPKDAPRVNSVTPSIEPDLVGKDRYVVSNDRVWMPCLESRKHSSKTFTHGVVVDLGLRITETFVKLLHTKCLLISATTSNVSSIGMRRERDKAEGELAIGHLCHGEESGEVKAHLSLISFNMPVFS